MAEYRNLPSVDALSRSPQLAPFPEALRLRAARQAVSRLRRGASAEAGQEGDPELLAVRIAAELFEPSLKPAINLTGVLLHTGLGRARLAPCVAQRIASIANSHAALELDLDSGERGDRQAHVRGLLQELTECEDALVVNNCAGALLLSLTALCAGREVILSRGQMVEIGGSFRIPDVVRQSGCTLVEVGCTNKTRASDYEAALGGGAAAILRCHPSNFQVVGFTYQPSASELASLAHSAGALLIDDLGSGCVVDTTKYGLRREPTLKDALIAGADIVTASADKLLGGPQAGLILGRTELIEQIRAHPLARALRIDKLSLAGLEATLQLYRDGREREIPLWRYASRTLEEVNAMCLTLAQAYSGDAVVEEGVSELGGGSLPGEGVPTMRVGLLNASANKLGRSLRLGCPPIVGRIEHGKVWLDPRTLEPDELEPVCKRLQELRP